MKNYKGENTSVILSVAFYEHSFGLSDSVKDQKQGWFVYSQ
jgi:hypothetical protein